MNTKNTTLILSALLINLNAACVRVDFRLDDEPKETQGNPELVSSRLVIDGDKSVMMKNTSSEWDSGMKFNAHLVPPVNMSISAFDASGLTAYVASTTDELHQGSMIDVVDLSDRSNPVLLKSMSLNATVKDIKVKDNFLMIQTVSNLQSFLLVVDRSSYNVIAQKFVSTGKPVHLSVEGDELSFVTISGTVKIDIKEPSSPLILTQSTDPLLREVTTQIYRLVLSLDSRLSLIFNNPLTQTAQVTSEKVVKFQKQNSLLYALTDAPVLKITDISQTLKNETAQVGSELPLEANAKSIAMDQQVIYVASGEKGTLIIDATNPLNPEMKGYFF